MLVLVVLTCIIAFGSATISPHKHRAPPALPLPARDIPSNLNPPLGSGRVDVHGWLWLPTEQTSGPPDPKVLTGWFYHHTPEFWTTSPHDFEIMVKGQVVLDDDVPNLPVPPKVDVVGTEYVFTPPSFSLDQLITSTVLNYRGRFTNGSFDTPQRYVLGNGTLTVSDLVTVHYLSQDATSAYTLSPYFSYPRKIGDTTSAVKHLYFLHLEEKMPDFDQIIHVTLDPTTCTYAAGDTISDVIAPGANFVFPNYPNDVKRRVGPWNSGNLDVTLYTERTKNGNEHTTCKVHVLEENHCVVVPDSFANCPATIR